MIGKFIEKRKLNKLKMKQIADVNMDIEDLLNDFTKNMSVNDTLITVSQLKSLISFKKYVEKL